MHLGTSGNYKTCNKLLAMLLALAMLLGTVPGQVLAAEDDEAETVVLESYEQTGEEEDSLVTDVDDQEDKEEDNSPEDAQEENTEEAASDEQSSDEEATEETIEDIIEGELIELLMSPMSDSQDPELSINDGAGIYSLMDTAIISFTSSEGASVYYTTDGTEPTSESTLASGSAIELSAPEDVDGGIITLKAIAIAEELTSEVQSCMVSFYRTVEDDESLISLEIGDMLYYFSTLTSAFTAATNDANLNGTKAIFTLLQDIEFEFNSNITYFKNPQNGITEIELNLNDCTLTVINNHATIIRYLTFYGEESFAIYGGTVVLDRAYLSFATESCILRDMTIDADKNIGVIHSLTVGNSEEALFDNLSITSASTYAIRAGTKCVIQNSTIDASIHAINVYTTKGVEVINCNITANDGYVFYIGTGAYPVTVDGGTYTGEHVFYMDKTSTTECVHRLKDGIFTGDFTMVHGQEAYILIENGYYKGEWIETLASNASGEAINIGSIGAPYSTSEEVIEGEYAGYTKYTKIANSYTSFASITTKGLDSFTVFDGMFTYDSTNGTIDTTVYPGKEISYSVRLREGYIVTGITYQLEGESEEVITLEGNEQYVVDDLDASYTMTVPEGNYSISFVIEEDESLPIILKVTDKNNGETEHRSLTTVLDNLQDGDTITLLDNVVYKSAIVITNDDITIDLNGNTLNLVVPTQSEESSLSQYSIEVKGSLTVQDSSSLGEGAISFGNYAGILLRDSNASFTLNSGTLTDLNTSSASHYSIKTLSADSSTPANAPVNITVNINGGLIIGRVYLNAVGSTLYMTSGTIQANTYREALRVTAGSVYMSGGQLYSHADVPNSSSGVLNLLTYIKNGTVIDISGGSIVSENVTTPIYVGSSASYAKIIFSGNTEIISEYDTTPAMKVVGGTAASYASVYIGDDVIFSGGTYAIEFVEASEKYWQADGTSIMAAVDISGGYFACGADYIPISDTYYVSFPTTEGDNDKDLVLNTQPVSDGDFEGYYTLTTKQSLSGSYESNGGVTVTYTYQNFEGSGVGDSGLAAILDKAATFSNDDGQFLTEAWSNFSSAYLLASRIYDMNRNANQNEIDYRAAILSAAMIVLENTTDFDVEQLADGTYGVQVEMLKLNLSGRSMSADAFAEQATLVVKNGKYLLTIGLQPINVSSLWGHVTDLSLWEGDSFSVGVSNANAAGSELNPDTLVASTYSNFYAHNEEKGYNGITFRMDVEGTGEQSADYPYPGNATMTLPYIGTTLEESSYACRLSSDVMIANAALTIKWSTLEAIDVSATIRLSEDELRIYAGATQVVEATLLEADGYELNWSIGNEAYASVNGTATVDAVSAATVTGISAGETTLIATAKKDGAVDVSTEIPLLVYSADTSKMTAETTVTDGASATTVSGEALLTNVSETVILSSDTVTIDASSDQDVSAATVTIASESLDVLVELERKLEIQCDLITVSFSVEALNQIDTQAGSNDVIFSVKEIAVPTTLGSFTAAYSLELTADANDITFDNGNATVTISDTNASYVYYFDDSALLERKQLVASSDSVSFTTTHFSNWALSTKEYTLTGSTSGNENNNENKEELESKDREFPEDGNYYVEVHLWKSSENEASMGDVAFTNNREALVTVSNGKVTTVRIATNPVKVSGYYSAIVDFSVTNATVSILEKESLTTEPAGNTYQYIKSLKFTMPAEGIPEYANEITYVDVGFVVPDTPMDEAVDGDLEARLRFVWSTAYATTDTSLNANSGTATGTSSITGQSVKDVELIDEETGITLLTTTDYLDDSAKMSVSVLTEGSDYELAAKALESVAESFALFKIVLAVDGVETQPEGSVKIYFPSNGKELTIYRINSDGSKTLLQGQVISKCYVVSTSSVGLFAITQGELTQEQTELENPFTDVADDHWALDYILKAVALGLFKGTSDTEFSPAMSMNRAMFVTVLGRLEGVDASASGETDFSDVAVDAYYAPYVAWASENGIVNGTSQTSFSPDSSISRQEMATMLYRYISYKGIVLEQNAGIDFTDGADIAAWAEQAVAALSAAGIINGVGDNQFAPLSTASRAEVAALFVKFMEACMPELLDEIA